MKDIKQKKKDEKSNTMDSSSPFFRMSNFKSRRFADKPKQNVERKPDPEIAEIEGSEKPKENDSTTLKPRQPSNSKTADNPPKVKNVQKAENPKENVERKVSQSPPSEAERKGLKRKPDLEMETSEKRSKLSEQAFEVTTEIRKKEIPAAFLAKKNTEFVPDKKTKSTNSVSSKKNSPTIKDLFEKKLNLHKGLPNESKLNEEGLHQKSKGLKRKSENEEQEIDQTKKKTDDERNASKFFGIFNKNKNGADKNTDEESKNKCVRNGDTNLENKKKNEENRHANGKNGKKNEENGSKNVGSGEKQSFSGVRGFCLDCDGCEVGCNHFHHSRILFRDLAIHQKINRKHSRFQRVNN